MKTILAVVLVLVVVAIGGCATGGPGAYLPTPAVTMTPPAPDLAPELVAFFGAWEGSWDGVLRSRLIVEGIDTNSARVVYIWGDQREYGVKAGWARYNANVVAAAKIQFGSNTRFTFTMSKDQRSIEGVRETPDRRVNLATMQRIVQ